MFIPMTVPTEFAACVEYMQQIYWLYREVQALREDVTLLHNDVEDLKERIANLENNA